MPTTSKKPETLSPADRPAGLASTPDNPVPAPTPLRGGLPAARRLPGWQTAIMLATPIALLIATWGVPAVIFLSPSAPGPPAPAGTPDGARLYAQHCASCHGESGNGSGVAYLNPPARDFGEGKFRLATTANGVPTDDDLRRLLRGGIPGSAMPGFPQLADGELVAVVDHVRGLTRTGVYARLRRAADAQGDEPDFAALAAIADRATRPGPPVDVPPLPASTPESVARGRLVYAATCVQCHGPEGRGDGPQVKDLKNDNGWPTRPRDLTAGVFKGGRERERLYARVVLGMPGTPMPASPMLPPESVADVVNYVLSLSPGPAAGAPPAADRGGVRVSAR
jgi:mono/diheme cytochrome c family protein